MTKRKKRSPTNISLRKAEIFFRHEECEILREQGISPLDRAHQLLIEVDPKLSSIMELKREILLEKK